MIDRRSMLAGMGAGAGMFALPSIALARADTSKKLVFLLQRGAADGMMALAPLGDPGHARLRAPFEDQYDGGRKLDGVFTMHPALEQLGSLYGAGELALFPAVATGYRDRSHFEAQNVIETGDATPYRLKSGWLNRLAGLLPEGGGKAIMLGKSLPQALQGSAPASSFTPDRLGGAEQSLLARVSSLYSEIPLLSQAWEEALDAREMAGDAAGFRPRDMEAAGSLLARLMTGEGGAAIGMFESGGWDTHANQPGAGSRALAGLGAFVGALREGMAAEWHDTMVIVATEFGRTAAINGTMGTDHGTASLAYVLGGAVNGGRIMGDWPGLAVADLYDGRDLAPALSLESVLAGAVGEHMGIEPGLLAQTLFPNVASLDRVDGLVA